MTETKLYVFRLAIEMSRFPGQMVIGIHEWIAHPHECFFYEDDRRE
jgi:hypothetical protein